MDDYYRDIQRWSFNMEVFFLKERFHDLLEIERSEKTIIQDRSIYEGVYVFAATNKAMGNMSDRDYDTYMELFGSMMMIARQPDLIIYLRASVAHLVENIQKRGRDYEQTIQLDYLKQLNNRYEDFIFNQYNGRRLVVEKDGIDFANNRHDLATIIDHIDAELFGLFSN